MNAPEKIPLGDVQSRPDSRNLRIDAVGVKGIRHPLTIQSGAQLAPTIGTFSMTVALEATDKGTHMSRFIELLEAQGSALTAARFQYMAAEMLERLQAPSGTIELRFPYFMTKVAPVSGVTSQLDYEVCWQASVSDEVYGLLKRPDEKYVTERAYDNPKFVEDIVRDTALALNADRRIGAYVVETENFESIHNHSAFARISRKHAL
jgi:GTP cyclohydrolase IB